jgi:formylglycine-generating enzyme required for sulfatase activity
MAPAEAWTPPTEFEEYKLLRPLGRGAMGDVYLALDSLLDRKVAVKFVARDSDGAARERFFREARALAKLSHPNVVGVYRVGEIKRRPYLITEFLEGEPLDRLAKPVVPDRVLAIGVDLARGLAAAHRHGILHRDVKPANAFLTAGGTVKLLDFGLAKAPSLDDDVTGPVGSPLYMAPELWQDALATPRSDVYALGTLLYELCAGRAPHHGVAVVDLPATIQQASAPLVDIAPTVRAELAAIIDRCIAVDPEARFEDADALREALEALVLQRDAPVPEGNPYRGLASFEAEHRGVFFGRAAEVGTVLERLRSDGFVLVVADSGVGKSSLCRAGVVPLVAEGALGSAMRVATFVPGSSPLESLARALPSDGDDSQLVSQLRSEPGSVGRDLRRRGGVLVLVDQLEEVSTLASAADAEAFMVALAALRAAGVHILATARSDFLGRLAAFPGLGESLGRAVFMLRPLGRAGLREAIVGPARVKRVAFESDDIVEELVASVASDPGALPLLQFTLAELWNAREGHAITRAALDAIGGATGALTRHADGVLTALSPAAREASRHIFVNLVTAQGTRARRTADELGAARAEIRDALDVLVRQRLLVARDGKHDTAYELVHEALISHWPTLRDWLAHDAGARITHARLSAAAVEWERLADAPELLWRGRLLDEAGAIDTSLLGARELRFLARSRRALTRRRWRVRGIVAGVVFAIVVVYAGVRLQNARERAAQVRTAVAEARPAHAAARTRRDAGLALREQAYRAYDAGKRDDGEVLWLRARDSLREAEASYARAAQAFETAYLLDIDDVSVKHELARVMSERIALAAAQSKLDEARAHGDRLALFDPARSQRSPTAAVDVTIEGNPVVTIERYRDVDGIRTTEVVDSLRSPFWRELPPGSYRLVAGDVRLPVVLAPSDRLRVAFAPPAKIPDGYVYVPPGRFLYGFRGDEDLRRGWFDAEPEHPASTDGYLIGRTEVTFAQWFEFLDTLSPQQRALRTPGYGASSTALAPGAPAAEATGEGAMLVLDGSGARRRFAFRVTTTILSAAIGEPIVYPERTIRARQDWLQFPVSAISRDDAEAYAAWLDRSGKLPGARLCTELEWERAARGADDRQYPHGDRITSAHANLDVTYGRKDRAFGPDAVGSFPDGASPFGVLDLAGNVFELTTHARDPEQTVMRGGTWYQDAVTARSVNRAPASRMFRHLHTGARICANAR